MLSILNVRSNSHNSCEDSVYAMEDKEYVWGVIADGCSTGIKSHFASQAIAYFIGMEQDSSVPSNYTVRKLRDLLKQTKDLFKISHMHLLSTCILFQYSKNLKLLVVRALGDGVYYINEGMDNREGIVIDQNNTPDYIAYHIDDTAHQFEQYLDKYPSVMYNNVDKFMICSDGIHHIDRADLLGAPIRNPKILFENPVTTNYHVRMWNLLKRDGYTLSDDLTIVSYVSENSEKTE